MPRVYPIEKSWIAPNAGPVIRSMYPGRRMGFRSLKEFIEPEDIANNSVFGVELMVAILESGGWLFNTDWRPYVRYSIAKRMRTRSDMIFTEAFLDVKQDFLEFQLHGGGFKVQDMLRTRATVALRHPVSTARDKAVANLIMSTLDGIQFNTLVQPFHWIRICVALSDKDFVFGMSLYQSEMRKQKLTLCKMLRTTS